MRLIALLSCFDERLDWLAELVASLARARFDHVVFLDGPYFLYPDAINQPNSGSDAAAVVAAACAGARMGCTIHQPAEPWLENETGKRSALFELGHFAAEPGRDWLVVVDGDEVWDQTHDLRPALEATDRDAADVLLYELVRQGAHEVNRLMIRKCFRAHPGGIRVVGTHYRYVDGDGRLVWNAQGPTDIDAEVLPSVRVRHRPAEREGYRQAKRMTYYDRRSDMQIEEHPLAG